MQIKLLDLDELMLYMKLITNDPALAMIKVVFDMMMMDVFEIPYDDENYLPP
jgi:hypothetical protein